MKRALPETAMLRGARRGTARYYELDKRVWVRFGIWTITGRAPTRQNASACLFRFGFHKARWEPERRGVWRCDIRVRR